MVIAAGHKNDGRRQYGCQSTRVVLRGPSWTDQALLSQFSAQTFAARRAGHLRPTLFDRAFGGGRKDQKDGACQNYEDRDPVIASSQGD